MMHQTTHVLAQSITIPGGTVTNPYPVLGGNTLDGVLNIIIPFVIAFAGIGLLLVIINGGFTLMMSAGDAKKMEAGKQQLTNGVLGFVLIIVAYWLVQIAGYVLGMQGITNVFNQ